MPSKTNRQIVVAELPSGPLLEKHFEHREAPMPKPGKGEVLTRTIHLSIDPANRAWMHGATYREAVKEGDVMHGGAVGQVVESDAPDLAPGDFFGEAALLSGRPRTATIQARGEVECLRLSREAYDELVRDLPRIREVMDEFNRRRAQSTIEALIKRRGG